LAYRKRAAALVWFIRKMAEIKGKPMKLGEILEKQAKNRTNGGF
jgi:hypothetical protein